MSRGRVIAALGIYATCAALSWGAIATSGRSPWQLDHALISPRWLALGFCVLLGVALGAGVVALCRVLVRRSRWARSLHIELRRGLAGLSPRAVAPLALGSAIGEEIFFRAWIQTCLVDRLGTVMGLTLASAAFGLAHVPWNRRLVSWTLMAGVMGLVFGGLYLTTGELLAPIVAHAVINYENLHFLLVHDPPPDLPTLTHGAKRA